MPRPYQQVTSCDWLSFSVIMLVTDNERKNGIVLNQPTGYILKDFGGTNIYKKRAMLFTQDGDKILTLLWEPHSGVLNPNSLFVEVANKVLYTGYDYILDLLRNIHDYIFQSVSRFDICTDFAPNPYQLKVIDQLQSGQVYVQGKREGSMFHTYHQKDTVSRVPKCMSWGSPYSTVKFKLYNKTKEIFEPDKNGRLWCNKPYILDTWRCNGLATQNDIWRLEVSLTSASSHQWRGERIEYSITAIEQYTPLFYDLVSTRWVLRKNEGHKYKRYDKVIPFLIIPSKDHYRLRRTDPKTEQQHTDHAATLRNLLKELDRPEIQCNRNLSNTLLCATEQVIEHARLQQYFRNMTGEDFETWAKEFYENLPC